MEWHTLSVDEVAEYWMTDTQTGLTTSETNRRLIEHGPNQIEEKEESILEILIEPFTEPMMILLIVVGIIYSFLGELEDAIAIFIIIMIIGFIEIVQERRAELAVSHLKEMTVPLARVIRDSQVQEISSNLLVPGDLLLLEAGSRITADARLARTINMYVEESSLTGEALPVEKQPLQQLPIQTSLGNRTNMVFAGTTVMQGRGSAIIVSTGMNTELGRIASLVQEIEDEPTSLQNQVNQLTKWFVLTSLFTIAIVLIIGVLQSLPFIDVILFGLSLAIATIPEDLPIILVILLVLGSYRMAKHKVLVKHLHSVETLGSTTVICTDKTGTLTENQMRLSIIRTRHISWHSNNPEIHYASDIEKALQIGVLCNNAIIEDGIKYTPSAFGDPIEVAILQEASVKIKIENFRSTYELLYELPFDSTRRTMSTIHKTQQGFLQVSIKGAPEEILSRCQFFLQDGEEVSLTIPDRETILQTNRELAGQGLRLLAVAYKIITDLPVDDLGTNSEEQNLVFVALLGFKDPPRPEVPKAIEECQKAGVRTVMITGDHSKTALAIANELQLGSTLITGQELDNLTDEEYLVRVQDIDIYARVTPEQKLRIVQALKYHDEIVVMTGDGINDAPALRQADIGIAMGETGTDVARDAADIILMDDNYETIVKAIRDGRRIYSNLQKSLCFYLTMKLSILGIALLATLLGLPLPFLPIQIILMEVLTDILVVSAFESEPVEFTIMHQPPREQNKYLISNIEVLRVFAQGFVIIGSVVGLFIYTLYANSLFAARSVALASTLFALVSLAFTSRSRNQPIYRLGLLSNRPLVLLSLGILITTVLAMQAPIFQTTFDTVGLTLLEWALVLVVAFLSTFWIEVVKTYRIRGKPRE